jgi:DNA polymerase I-like protein with 3'-5' exonuclease and polymerase domains/uracil-DNA glycosylase
MGFLQQFHDNYNSIKPNARICVVADYPSHADQQLNQGFSDSAGSTLAQCIGHSGMSMGEVSLIFVIPEPSTMAESTKYWTPKGGFTTLATRHFAQLAESIKEANANVYVPLGEISLQALTNKRGITKWRGSILESIDYYGSVKVIPTIDPRTAIRQYLYRYFISADFKRIATECNSKELNLTPRNLMVQPSFLEAKSFLEYLQSVPVIAADIEVYKMEVSCISFASSATECMSIPFNNEWTLEEEAILWLLVARIVEDPSKRFVYQNGMFDLSFMFAKNHIHGHKPYIDDTMIKHNLNYPDFPKGLGFITSLYTREPYYKDEGKTWFNDLKGGTGDIAQFYLYNAKDSAVCFEANEPISKELTRFGNDKTYEFNQRLFRPLLYMQARGILVDEAKLAAHRVEARKQRDELQSKLKELAGFDLNVASPLQCKKFFYETKGYPVQTKKTKDPKTGLRKETISADDKAMKRLIRKFNSEEAKLVTQIRKYRKLIGTYLEVQYDTDKRLRCSFNMAGTNTGRLSSSETIFGTGTNMQNLPKTFKEFLIADPGHVIVEVDKSQAEWVATAFVSGDGRMIEAVLSGIDAHIHTANLMFGIPKELILKEHQVLETSTDEDWIKEQRAIHCPEILTYRNILPNMSCRQAGKKSNHSFNYGLSPQGFAIQYDLEVKYAKQCYQLYHNAYPGLTLWHQHIRNKLSKDRTLENLFGRKRRFLNRWNDDLFKAAYSYIPQSTIGQLLNYGIVETYYQQDLEEYNFLRSWDLLNQVHDSMVFQYPADKVADLVKTIKQIQINLDPKLYANGREFVIKTDCKIGLNCKKLYDIDIYADAETMQTEIETLIADKLTTHNEPIAIDLEEVEDDDETVIEE